MGEVSEDGRFQNFLRDINAEWDKLEDKAKSDKATKQEQGDAKSQMEALAKGLPALATGIRDAVKGFQSGDAFAGSAAVMDICASLASTIGAMAGAAGGPPGALVGALFSIVSMILKMFIKEQKSLTAQIEEIIRTIKSESKIQNLHVAQQAIQAFLNTVLTKDAKWDLAEYEAKLNVIDGMAINSIRGAAEWLEEPKNQELPLWGHVLAAQCDAYMSLMKSLTIAITSMDITQLEDRGAKNIGKLTAAFKSNDPIQLKFLNRIKQAAQTRGTFWHIGTFYSNAFDREIYPDSGWLMVRDSMTAPWKTLDRNYHRAVTVSKTKTTDSSNPNPYLAIFALEPVLEPH